jgi:hypothetical protein
MAEEAVRRAHKCSVDEGVKGYRARCSCRMYRGSWQEYRGIAVQLHRIHVQKKVEEDAALTEEGGTSSAGEGGAEP